MPIPESVSTVREGSEVANRPTACVLGSRLGQGGDLPDGAAVSAISTLWRKAEGSALVAVLLTWVGVTLANILVVYLLVAVLT